MQGKSFLIVAVAVFALAESPVRAEGWKMPNLIPFKKKDSHPAHLRVTDEPSPWWKPKLPSLQGRKSKPASEPSTWNKMSSGTRRAWTKTKDVLNPFDDAQDKPKDVTGYNTHFTQQASHRKEEKEGSSWWPWTEEKPKRPQTVQDFLSQERPY